MEVNGEEFVPENSLEILKHIIAAVLPVMVHVVRADPLRPASTAARLLRPRARLLELATLGASLVVRVGRRLV